jgi:hypothetical protein
MEIVGKALGTLMALAIQSLALQEILLRKSILHNANMSHRPEDVRLHRRGWHSPMRSVWLHLGLGTKI